MLRWHLSFRNILPLIGALATTSLYQNCAPFKASELIASSSNSLSDSAPPNATQPSKELLGPELVQNPGFENGVTSWEDYGTVLAAASGVGGTTSVRFGVTAGGVGQSVKVVAGHTYRISAAGKADADNGGASFSYNMKLPDGTSQGKTISIFSSGYQRITADVTAPPGADALKLAAWSNQGKGSAYLDDVSVKEIINGVAIKPVLADDGDSISAAPHASWYASVTPNILFSEHAVGGSGLSGATGNTLEAREAALLSMKPANGPFIISILIGANDLASASSAEDYATRLFAYCDRLRASGAKVALGTVLPRALPNSAASDVVHNQYRAVLNPMIRNAVGQHIDAVIDYAADPLIGLDTSPTNLTYYLDGLHPTWAPGGGQERMFLIYKSALDKLLSSAE